MEEWRRVLPDLGLGTRGEARRIARHRPPHAAGISQDRVEVERKRREELREGEAGF
jgi:hypothetical protein